MSADKIWAILSPLAIAAVLLGSMFAMDRCSTRNQEFRLSCVNAGGTLVETGASPTCVNGKTVVRQ